MALEDYINVNIKEKGNTHSVKIQKGCSFENNGSIYHVNNSGQLTVFDKQIKKWEKADEIKMTGYQFSIFKAVADNEDEQYNKKSIGDIVLSEVDIDKGIQLFNKNKDKKKDKKKENALKTDLKTYLPTGYTIEHPMIYSKYKSLSAYVDSGDKNTSGTVVFGFTSQKDAQIISDVAHQQPISKNDAAKNSNDVKTQQTKPQKTDKPKSEEKPNENNTIDSIISNFEGGNINISKVKDISTVAKYTGVSANYIKEILVGMEGKKSKPLLTAEYDNVPDKTHPKGYLTIGFGHTALSGAPRPYEGMKITEQQAYQILANDIIVAKNGAKKRVGKENYTKCPKSLQNALIDIVFNKGPSGINSRLKNDIKNGSYHKAAVSTWYTTPVLGLKKRNMYRFIEACKNLSLSDKQNAIKSFHSLYGAHLNKVFKCDSGAKNAWNNLCIKAGQKQFIAV